MDLKACPECAGGAFRPPEFSDGVALGGGELLELICERCGFRGQPLLFDTQEAFEAFRASKAAATSGRRS